MGRGWKESTSSLCDDVTPQMDDLFCDRKTTEGRRSSGSYIKGLEKAFLIFDYDDDYIYALLLSFYILLLFGKAEFRAEATGTPRFLDFPRAPLFSRALVRRGTEVSVSLQWQRSDWRNSLTWRDGPGIWRWMVRPLGAMSAQRRGQRGDFSGWFMKTKRSLSGKAGFYYGLPACPPVVPSLTRLRHVPVVDWAYHAPSSSKIKRLLVMNSSADVWLSTSMAAMFMLPVHENWPCVLGYGLVNRV